MTHPIGDSGTGPTGDAGTGPGRRPRPTRTRTRPPRTRRLVAAVKAWLSGQPDDDGMGQPTSPGPQRIAAA